MHYAEMNAHMKYFKFKNIIFFSTEQDYVIEVDDYFTFMEEFTPWNHRIAIPIRIIEDSLPELDESFQMVAFSAFQNRALFEQNQQTFITIQDNDGSVLNIPTKVTMLQ